MQSDVKKRRIERQRIARRRHLLIGFIFFLIVALIALAIMCFTVFFKVEKLEVTGNKIYTAEEVRNASGITTKDNLFTISEKRLEAQMRKKLPYIDGIEIKRKLPDKLIINVVDAKEYLYFEADKSYFILSDNGYLLKESSDEPNNLIKIISSGIKGALGEKAVFADSNEEKALYSLIDSLKNNNIKINEINVKNKLQIKLKVEDNFTVNFGNDENINEKVKHLSTMLNDLSGKKGTINLSMWTTENRHGSFKPEKD